MYKKEIVVNSDCSKLIEPTMEELRKPNFEATIGESRAATEFNRRLEGWMADGATPRSTVGVVSNGLTTVKATVLLDGCVKVTLTMPLTDEETNGFYKA